MFVIPLSELSRSFQYLKYHYFGITSQCRCLKHSTDCYFIMLPPLPSGLVVKSVTLARNIFFDRVPLMVSVSLVFHFFRFINFITTAHTFLYFYSYIFILFFIFYYLSFLSSTTYIFFFLFSIDSFGSYVWCRVSRYCIDGRVEVR